MLSFKCAGPQTLASRKWRPNARASAACGSARLVSFYDNLAGKTTLINRLVASWLHALFGRLLRIEAITDCITDTTIRFYTVWRLVGRVKIMTLAAPRIRLSVALNISHIATSGNKSNRLDQPLLPPSAGPRSSGKPKTASGMTTSINTHNQRTTRDRFATFRPQRGKRQSLRRLIPKSAATINANTGKTHSIED